MPLQLATMSARRCVVVLCVCFFFYISSVVESRHTNKDIDSSDGCKVKNKLYKVGDEWSPRGVCQRNTCLKGGAIGGKICPLIRLPENSECFITEEDASKGWPDCCGQIFCPPPF